MMLSTSKIDRKTIKLVIAENEKEPFLYSFLPFPDRDDTIPSGNRQCAS